MPSGTPRLQPGRAEIERFDDDARLQQVDARLRQAITASRVADLL